MSIESDHAERVTEWVNEQRETHIGELAIGAYEENRWDEYENLPIGILARTASRFARVLSDGYRLEQQQKFEWSDVLLLHFKAAFARIGDKRVKMINHTLEEPMTFRPEIWDLPVDFSLLFKPGGQENIQKEMAKHRISERVDTNAYSFKLPDGTKETPDFTLESGWMFTYSLMPARKKKGKIIQVSDEGKFWDLDIYRYSEVQDLADKVDTSSMPKLSTELEYHIRFGKQDGHLVTRSFWAFQDGERLDELQVVGTNAMQTAHGLICQAEQELTRHLSTKKR